MPLNECLSDHLIKFNAAKEAIDQAKILEQWQQLAFDMISELRMDYAPGDMKDTDSVKAIKTLRKNNKRWMFYAKSPQTALMLGSKEDPNDKNINWIKECNKLADELIRKYEE